MLPLCKQWFKSSGWHQECYEKHGSAKVEDLLKLKGLLQDALRHFREWRREKLYNEECTREAISGSIPTPTERDGRTHINIIRKQMDDLLAPPPKDTSSSTPKNDPAPSRTSSSLAPLSQAASSSKSRQINWWSFEYALTAGRRWLQIVRQQKSEQ
jgi:hypothetical protein